MEWLSENNAVLEFFWGIGYSPVSMLVGVLFLHPSMRLSNHRSTAWTRDSVKGEEALVSSKPNEDMASSVIR